MKFRCIFVLTFWYTLYISEKSTAKVILEDESTDIQPADESSNVIIEEMFQINTEEITEMRNGILFPPPTNESSNDIIEDMSDMARKGKKTKSARNCLELKKQDKKLSSGIYSINPCDAIPAKVVKVYCDMDTEGGGFTVIQRRGNYNNQQDFYLNWNEYALGFGDVAKDFYLGNDNINCLTKQSYNEIRFDLEDWTRNTTYAVYDFFHISDQADNYTLNIGNYTGTAGDSFTYHNNMQFSTFDAENAVSSTCAVRYKGAWWYKSCYYSNLNGVYNGTSYTGLVWYTFGGSGYSLKTTEMKIRPKY